MLYSNFDFTYLVITKQVQKCNLHQDGRFFQLFFLAIFFILLLKNWANNKDSAEIQSEFSANATCIDSKKYKSYKLI